MCGRITLTRPNLESIASELNVAPENYRGYPLFEPRYNAAPTDVLPILTLDDERGRWISPMTWGSVPKGRKGLTINWRAESFPRRAPRCAVITDGFYEWTGPKEARQPYWFHRTDHALVLLAGLWKFQQLPAGTVTQVFVVLTTRPNSVMAPIHDRMPIVLDQSQVDNWMNRATSEALARSLLRSAPDDWLVADKASPLVNSVKNDGPELLAGLLD